MGDVVMPRAGVLRIREPAGRTVPVGTVIAELA